MTHAESRLFSANLTGQIPLFGEVCLAAFSLNVVGDRQDPQLTKRNPKRAVNRYAMQAALGMMRKVHKASRIASYMGSMATVTQGAVTMVAIATTMLPGVETFGCPQTMAYQESINVSNSFIEGRGVPEPRTVSDDTILQLYAVGETLVEHHRRTLTYSSQGAPWATRR